MRWKSVIKTLLLIIVFSNATNIVFASEIPDIVGKVAITMDMNTGEVLYSKNAHEKHSLASTTKLLTALLFAENKNKTDQILYTDVSASLKETSLNGNFMGGSVVAGDSMIADDVMKAVMVFSANDAAILMAESVAGTVEEFSKMMNDKAKELGAVNSNFINPNGLELENGTYNTTTAYDLALIGIAAYKNDWIRDTMGLKDTSVTLKGMPIYISTRNKNLGKSGNMAGKTGTETNAGHCFVGFYYRDGREIVTVVLGSNYGNDGTIVFDDTESIANYSYDLEKELVKSKDDEIAVLNLEYKLFGFFGPTKSMVVPVLINEDVYGYNNTYNDMYGGLELVNKNYKDAWKISKNNTIEIIYKSGFFEEKHTATAKLSTRDIFNDNKIEYTISGFIVVVISAGILIVSVKVIRGRKSKIKNIG